MITLAAKKRDASDVKAPVLRRAGLIPAVVYGAHKEATPITVIAGDFEKTYKEAGEASVISITGIGAAIPVLINEVDRDPITNHPRHIDFYAVTKGEKIEVEIPIEFIGEAPAVKAGATLVKVLHEIEVEADPMDLPREIEVDVSSLGAVGDQIHVKDISLPAGVSLITDPEEVVALAQEVAVQEEEEPSADLSEIEVEEKGKEKEAESPEG